MASENPEIKISRAFEQYLAECGPNDKRDAIVIFKAPETAGRVRGRVSALKQRLNLVKDHAAANGPLQMRVLEQYQRRGARVRRESNNSTPQRSERTHSLLLQ
jgi:hypothetical protein